MNTVNPIANVDSVDPATTGVEVTPANRPLDDEDDDVVDIKGKSKAEILMKLYNGASPVGLGMLQATHDWTLEDAELFLERAQSVPGKAGFGMGRLMFGDIFGRPVNVDLSGDKVNLRAYNRSHGKGAGQKAL